MGRVTQGGGNRNPAGGILDGFSKMETHTYTSYEGTHKTTVKEDGSSGRTWEGTNKITGGTGKFKNIKGSGTYRGKGTAERVSSSEWEGEVEY